MYGVANKHLNIVGVPVEIVSERAFIFKFKVNYDERREEHTSPVTKSLILNFLIK